MSILKELPELVKAGVISSETSDKIIGYYQGKRSQSVNWLFLVFGILGATLVGLGIILILAHNWDELSRITKTFFAFLPLLVGQILCGFTLLKKQDNTTWIESSTCFLFFSIGASISLVSQIYNIPGNLNSFIFSWMLLCIPLVYVMKSSMASLLFLSGITFYACSNSYWSYPLSQSYDYWWMLLMVLPHYYKLYKRKPESNFMGFHNWLIPLSVVITLGSIADGATELMFMAYFSLFGFLYMVSKLNFFSRQKLRNNGYKFIGSLGTIILLLILSFDWFWEDLRKADFQFVEWVWTPEFLASFILSSMAGVLLHLTSRGKVFKNIDPIGFVFVLFIATFLAGLYLSISVILINLYVFAIGLLVIRDGTNHDNLGILNYGLLIITALVTCRFFDANISFVVRGVLFLCVGIGFFASNYWMLKKRKANG